jgi:hypothetical protein
VTAPVVPDEEHYGCEFCGVDFLDLAEMEDHVCPNEPAQDDGGPDAGQDLAVWVARARALTERALFNFEADDPQPDLGAAMACLRVAEGALDTSELDGYLFPGEAESLTVCLCPADLLERGGYRGCCPVHGHAARAYLTGAGA